MAYGGGASRALMQLERVAAQGDGKRETLRLSPLLSPSDFVLVLGQKSDQPS